jgi:hypothetical protein
VGVKSIKVKRLMKRFYVYYSYEEWGRGYIGVKLNSDCPEKDGYFGSFKDKTFAPTEKIIIAEFGTPEEAINAEIKLHSFFEVDKNPHFVNQSRQTAAGFISLKKTDEHRRKISQAHIGKKLTPESIEKRQKNRIYATGEDHHMRKKGGHSPETREKIRRKRAEQQNVSGGCSHPWWVNEKGERTRSLQTPGEEWQRGMKWKPDLNQNSGKNH